MWCGPCRCLLKRVEHPIRVRVRVRSMQMPSQEGRAMIRSKGSRDRSHCIGTCTSRSPTNRTRLGVGARARNRIRRHLECGLDDFETDSSFASTIEKVPHLVVSSVRAESEWRMVVSSIDCGEERIVSGLRLGCVPGALRSCHLGNRSEVHPPEDRERRCYAGGRHDGQLMGGEGRVTSLIFERGAVMHQGKNVLRKTGWLLQQGKRRRGASVYLM